MDALTKFWSDSIERVVLHTKTRARRTSNGLSCNLRSFLIFLLFYHILCLQVFYYSTLLQLSPSAEQPEAQQGCQSHGRACQVHFYPSKAMAEAMDAADMPGLHSKLLKPHRNLGDAFNMFWRICCRVLGCFHLTELIEHVLHTLLKKMIHLTETCE